LCAKHNEKFYNRFAYHKIPFVKKISKLEKSILLDKDFTIRDVVFPNDVSALSHMYNIFSGKFNGPVMRNTVYWEKWVPAFEGGKFFIAIDSNMSPIAYISVSLENSRLYVWEFGYMEGYDDIFDSLISNVAEKYGTNDLHVEYQFVISSNMKVIEQVEAFCVMFKLIDTLSINDIHVENTQELLGMLQRDPYQSKLLLWIVDDI
jgi:hypothetical protein